MEDGFLPLPYVIKFKNHDKQVPGKSFNKTSIKSRWHDSV